jgi:PAS domain S-box-containing protein
LPVTGRIDYRFDRMGPSDLPAVGENERLRIERDLRVSEERLRAIFNSEPECVKVVDLAGRVLEMNAAGLAMLEADSLDQVRGTSVAHFVHPDDLASVQALLAQAVAGHHGTLIFRVITLKGRERWAESHASPLRAATDRVDAVLTVTHDITDRRRAAEERDLYAQAMRCMNVGLIIAHVEQTGDGPDFRLAAANEAALRLTKMTEAQLVGRTVSERFPAVMQSDLPEQALAAMRAGTPSLIGDVPYGDAAIAPSVFNVAFAPISDRSLAVTFQDVTEQRRLEEQLRHAQNMEAVGRLAGGVAHDFNNLLTVIIGYLDVALSAPTLPASMRSDIEQALSAADRAARVTGQLLAFSRRQLLQPKVIAVDALLRDLTDMLEMIVRENIHLTIALGGPGLCVRVDPGQLEQVILNLVVNACDAMPAGGTLVLRTSPLRADGADPSPWVRLTVSDTGVGMDEATRAQIFEPFFTTKGESGTGLGLASAYGIVKQSGGRVTCESRPGEGSSFHVDLPSVADAVEPAAPAAPRTIGGGESILLVEDNQAVRRMMAVTLEREGYHVDTAANGDEALALVRSGRAFDILVTDLVMPGMSGRNVADAVAQLSPATQIMFVSGYVDDPASSASFVHFLQKPFTPTALASKVREVLDARPTDS